MNEDRIFVVHTRIGRIGLLKREGKILAFQDICTHDNGPLSGGTFRGVEVECPRHGARFNIETGRVLCMPATEDIEIYAVRTNNDDIEIDAG